MNKLLKVATGSVIFGIPVVLFTFYGIFGGMPCDYSLAYLSESQPGWRGFLYGGGDSLRIYTNVFYHIGYWISKISGQPGSWIGYHLIYCILLAGKGLLVFSICRLLNFRGELSALAAVISLLHGSDSSLGHVGQLNQFGIVVWVLLSMYAFLLFLKQQNRGRYVWLGMAPLFSYLALWSYEGTLFGLLLYPTLFLWVRHQTRDRQALGGALFTTLPAIIYSLWWIDLIFSKTWGGTYQAAVVRNNFNISVIFPDFWDMASRLFNITNWINLNTWRTSAFTSDGTRPFIFFSLIAVLALLIYFSASLGISTYRVITRQASHRNEMTETPHVDALRIICTLLLLIASFLMPFVALKPADMSWRTQILSGPFASILGAIIITYGFLDLLKYIRISVRTRCALYSVISLTVLSIGFVSIIERYRTYNRLWESIRAPIGRLLQTIPTVRSGTVILLQNVPITADSLASAVNSNYWFDILLRLCYPNTKVSGSYTLAPAQPQSPEIGSIISSGGQFVTLSNGKSVLAPHGALHGIEGENVTLFLKYINTLIDSARLEDVIVLDWTDSGPFKIIRDANQINLAVSPRAENYHPENRIISQTASPIALRRFARLLPGPLDHNTSTGLSQK